MMCNKGLKNCIFISKRLQSASSSLLAVLAVIRNSSGSALPSPGFCKLCPL